MVKFIHAADVHLDSPLRGLERYETAPVDRIRSATRGALARLVRLAIAQKVDFVVLAGDIYDGDWADYNTGLHFCKALSELGEAGIRVFMISGNHDAASEISRSLRPPGCAITLSVEEAETIRLEDLGVAIHGRGFKSRRVTENLCRTYPKAEPGMFNIGMLHTSVAGYSGHDSYAPCSVEDMRCLEYDYWALGHVHQRIVLCEEPRIVFPGNIQGRHVRETGARGCTLVSVERRRIVSMEHHDLDVMRWQICDVDLPANADEDALYAGVAIHVEEALEKQDDLPLAARVQVKCGAKLHGHFVADSERMVNEIRRVAADASRQRAWIEKVKMSVAEEPAAAEAISDGLVKEIVALLEAMETDAQLRQEIAAELEPLRQKLPWAIRGDVEGLMLEDPVQRHQLLVDVRHLLMPGGGQE